MTDKELWSKYCSEKNIDPNTEYEAWQFGAAPDNLAALVMLGVKTATASGYDLYAIDDEPIPKVGEYSILLSSKDQPLCIIQTTKTRVIPYNEVPKEQAYKEGEGDRSLDYWREVHWKFFNEDFAEYGQEFKEDSLILCEEFQMVYSRYEVGAVTDKRRDNYYSVKKDGDLLGFFHIMDRGDYVELGVEIKPELSGKEEGQMLTELALAKIEEKYHNIRVELNSATPGEMHIMER